MEIGVHDFLEIGVFIDWSFDINLLFSLKLRKQTNTFTVYSDWVCTAVLSNDVMKDLRG